MNTLHSAKGLTIAVVTDALTDHQSLRVELVRNGRTVTATWPVDALTNMPDLSARIERLHADLLAQEQQ